jgi:hypothetical protein
VKEFLGNSKIEDEIESLVYLENLCLPLGCLGELREFIKPLIEGKN